MRLFECQHCGQPLYFDNTQCERCGHRLGYLPRLGRLSALEPDDGAWRPLATPDALFRFCANAEHGVCNWLVPADGPDTHCEACRHNRTIPDLSIAENVVAWRRLELAKHHLFYTLLRFGLPHPTRLEDPEEGLAFDFLADPPPDVPDAPKVMTGHANGLITLSLAEADDAERERRRTEMREPYRTLLGHFRHEVAHFYWDRLVRDSRHLARFRKIFGDEREDYGASLQRYYAESAPADWQAGFVTAYATAHPWEDFAETWAHYFHIVDTLETARAFGLKIEPRIRQSEEISTEIDFDPHHIASADRLIDAWLPLTFAMNSLNRSMGLPDLYPFVISPAVVGKLGFILEVVREAGEQKPAGRKKARAPGRRRAPSPA